MTDVQYFGRQSCTLVQLLLHQGGHCMCKGSGIQSGLWGHRTGMSMPPHKVGGNSVKLVQA